VRKSDEPDSFLLIETSFKIDPSVDPNDNERMEQVQQNIEKAVQGALCHLDGVQLSGSWSFFHIGDPDTNARRCSICKRWASDHTKLDCIDTLPWGQERSDGAFVCLECGHWEEIESAH
jgi:hypothetical protein